MDIAHEPVLKEETRTLLAPRGRNELMVDATVGEGGHSSLFLSTYDDLRVIAVDADAAILARARERLAPFGERVRFFNAWFNQFFKDYPRELDRPDTILFDLGISSYHLDVSGRGFSFRGDEPLDMRLSAELEISAKEIVNHYPEQELADLLYELAEERLSRRIAHSIVEHRGRTPFETTRELADVIYRSVPPQYRHGRIHPATRSFQALRIAVNGELARLESALEHGFRALKIGGRMGVISFHSLEDRRVKVFFREKNKSCTCPPEQPMCNCGGRRLVEILTKKPIEADAREREENSRSRSARLRVAVKAAEES